MTNVWTAIRGHFAAWGRAWDRFWFTAVDPAPLCAIRVVTGLLLLWTHLVWSIGLADFFGPNGWLPADLYEAAHQGRMTTSVFDYLGSGWLLWTVHVLNLIAFLMLTIGWWTRFAAVWSFVAAVEYATRVTGGAFFGLDKINCLLAMYVMLGPSGARYSVDALRRGGAEAAKSVMANFALRLLQLHLCVVYLFSGLGKLQGDRWWDGTATWFSVANPEYRSLDMTWMANHLWLIDLLTHGTVFFELFYAALIWPLLTRPWMLLGAISVHGFIGLAMGMPEFALAMLTANMAFLSAGFVRGLLDPVTNRLAAPFAKRAPKAEPTPSRER
ncbi:MAG: HTTM domain-containing protein [Lacipirellulaceae bacterium]